MVVPGMRVVIATSFLFDLVAICKEDQIRKINNKKGNTEKTKTRATV